MCLLPDFLNVTSKCHDSSPPFCRNCIEENRLCLSKALCIYKISAQIFFAPAILQRSQRLKYHRFLVIPIRIAFTKNIMITYPVSMENIDGTTSNKALQSSILTQSNTILYSIRSVNDTNASEQAENTQAVFFFFFDSMIQPVTQNITLKIPHIIHI